MVFLHKFGGISFHFTNCLSQLAKLITVQKLEYNKKNVGAALRLVRTQKGLKQSYVAKKAGISKELISKMENGKCDYRLCRVNQLLQIYRCPPLDFWHLFDYTGFLAIETCQPSAETAG